MELIDLNILYLYISMGIIAATIIGIFGGAPLLIPTLQYIFFQTGINEDIYPKMASATTLFILMISFIPNVIIQYKNGHIDLSFFKILAPFVIIGCIIGSTISTYIDAQTLKTMFYIFITLLAINLLIGKKTALIHNPNNLIIRVTGTFLGTLASMLGVGGGSVGTPIFLLIGFNMRKVIGNVTFLTFTISLSSTILNLFYGQNIDTGVAYSFGYINLLAVAIMGPIFLIFAPIGSKIGLKLPQEALKKILAILLICISAKVFMF